MPDYTWKPIEPLSDEERNTDLAGIGALYNSWRDAKTRLQESSGAELAKFNERLLRRLSVETGILERLYDLDRGTTEALVANGFLEDLVAHSSTNIEPGRLIDILRDHDAAVHLVIDCVTNKRAFTKGLLHELHTILTRHQDTTTAADPSGNRIEIPLLKGKFKEQPNNPRRPDGVMHEYCPPIHVDSEVDNLLSWLGEYSDEDPVIVAAWIHHRFTQIHPYQDGNGRIARALTTLVLLRADLLPLVVDRDLRTEYIKALELADSAQLSNLARLFARLERDAILQALSVETGPEVIPEKSLTSVVIESLEAKFEKRRHPDEGLHQVGAVALDLRDRAKNALELAFSQMRPTLAKFGVPEFVVKDLGPSGQRSEIFSRDIAQFAKEKTTFVNFSEVHYFVNASVNISGAMMFFVVSFHHVGQNLTGIMEAIAFVKQQELSGQSSLCSTEPFVFTHTTKVDDIAAAFEKWLDAALAVAIKEYGDRL